MKLIRGIVKGFFVVCTVLTVCVFGMLLFVDSNTATSYKVGKGEQFKLNSILPVTSEVCSSDKQKEKYSVDLKLFGVIPYQTVDVEVVDDTRVAVLGQPFGMRVYTEGVLVIDATDVTTKSGKQNPAKAAGIKIGDYIETVNGKRISTNEELADLVEYSGGNRLKFKVLRDNSTFTTYVYPVKDKESGHYKIGIWVRDSSAGIGTLTFYSPSTGVICGLGHGICDEDTDKLLTVYSGQMVSADIMSVKKGKSGTPGELNGRFMGEILGKISLNCESGVYGKAATNVFAADLTEIALKNDVKNGEAQILCTVDGQKPKLYSCEIKKNQKTVFGGEDNLTVTVTDGDLLEATGGIVQGMSGSPVLQNGRLIGAITHVLVDDPTTGYAIFAENMLETAQSVANSEKLRDAS